MEDKYIIHISNKVISTNFEDNYIEYINQNLNRIVEDDLVNMNTFVSNEIKYLIHTNFNEFKKRVIKYTNDLLKRYWMETIPNIIYKFCDTIPDKNEEDEDYKHFIEQLVKKDIELPENNVLKSFLNYKKEYIEYYVLQFYKRIVRDISDELISIENKKNKLKNELKVFFKGQNILFRNSIDYNKLYKSIIKYYRRSNG